MIDKTFMKKTLYMIIDKDEKICFCSKQSQNECQNILDDLGIIDYIREGKFGDIILKGNFISIRQLAIYNEKLYFIVLNNYG